MAQLLNTLSFYYAIIYNPPRREWTPCPGRQNITYKEDLFTRNFQARPNVYLERRMKFKVLAVEFQTESDKFMLNNCTRFTEMPFYPLLAIVNITPREEN